MSYHTNTESVVEKRCCLRIVAASGIGQPLRASALQNTGPDAMISLLISEDRALAGKQPERRYGYHAEWAVPDKGAALFLHKSLPFPSCMITKAINSGGSGAEPPCRSPCNTGIATTVRRSNHRTIT